MAARFRTYLESYTSPRREPVHPTGEHADPATGERLPYPVLMGHAFCSLLEAIPTERLPQHGGSPTTMVVTIDEHTLTTRVGAAQLATGDTISAAKLQAYRAGKCIRWKDAWCRKDISDKALLS